MSLRLRFLRSILGITLFSIHALPSWRSPCIRLCLKTIPHVTPLTFPTVFVPRTFSASPNNAHVVPSPVSTLPSFSSPWTRTTVTTEACACLLTRCRTSLLHTKTIAPVTTRTLLMLLSLSRTVWFTVMVILCATSFLPEQGRNSRSTGTSGKFGM